MTRTLPLALVLAACGSAADAARDAQTLVTVIDSTADTVSARTDGDLPADLVHTLVAEMSIAPGADDTTLFTNVSEFEMDGADRPWVYDRSSNTLLVFAPTGELVRRVGRQGAGPGEFNNNNGMVARSDGGIALLDYRNTRITFIDSTGGVTGSWPVPGGFNTSGGLISDRSGTLYLKRPVTPPREGEILGRMGLVRLGDDGAFGDSLAPPDLPVPREVYVASVKGNTSSTGSAHAASYLWAWHPEGYFLAADGGKFEIIAARPGQKPLVIRRSFAAVPVEAEERNVEKESITYNMRQTDPSWNWNGPALPEQKAPLLGLFAARDGRIWARVAVASELIPASELTPPRDSLRPVTRHRTPTVYEVFEADGRFVGRVAMPPRSSLMEAEGNTVWALVRDADDIPAVTRFRVDPVFP